MTNVTTIKPNSDVIQGLKNIIGDIDNGVVEADNCTIVLGTNVYHLGCVDDCKAATDAIFNLTFGIHKLMAACTD